MLIFTEFLKLSATFVIVLFPKDSFSYTQQDLMDASTKGNFRVLVEPGESDCYYIPTFPGVVLNVYFKVIRGGDGIAGFTIKNSNQQVVLRIESNFEATYSTTSAISGYYVACISNFEFFSTKVVFFSYETYLNASATSLGFGISENGETVEPLVKGITILDISNKINRIKQNISFMQIINRIKVANWARDFAFQQNINYNVTFWSCIQCTVILLASITNVYSIRKLFKIIRGR